MYVCMFVCFVWKISSKYKTFIDDGTMLNIHLFGQMGKLEKLLTFIFFNV